MVFSAADFATYFDDALYFGNRIDECVENVFTIRTIEKELRHRGNFEGLFVKAEVF
jgi:hypothetical protein